MLRRGFKAVCKATENRFQNYQIRVHRSLSWFERAQELDQESQPDGRLLYAWIALSSLYGTWEEELGYPARDRESRKAFVDMLMSIDSGELLVEIVMELRSDILWVLDNKYLDPRFWRSPEHPGNVHAKYYQAVQLYRDHSWAAIVEYTLVPATIQFSSSQACSACRA